MNGIKPAEIQKTIKSNKILNKLLYFKTIDSTNKFLSENKFASGTVVIAGKQTAGRGKHGSKWSATLGGLWFSFVINSKIKRPYDYVVLSAVAVAETLEAYGLKPEIKWPNDVLLDGKKIAGILLENDFYNARLIIGTGINVNNVLPKEPGLNAVSFKKLLKKKTDITDLAVAVINRMDAYVVRLKIKRGSLLKKWLKYQKNLENTEIRVVCRGKEEKVKVLKVTGGEIKYIDKKGRIRKISGEIFFK